MVVFHGFEDYRPLPCPAAVAVGNFDGFHLGHRKILAALCGLARSRRLSSLVLTFDPHPERALGKRAVRMIDTLEQRLERLRAAGVEAALVVRFDRGFCGLSARAFAENVLRGRLDASEVVVGRDFRFGRDRRAGIKRLEALGRQLGFGVHAVAPEIVGGRPVSSSLIRRSLARGRVEEAARLLGRPYEIAGTVVAGKALGRGLGAPTANVRTANEILPDGVFISVTVWKGQLLPSVTSIGTNPTFGRNPVSVETHILDRRVRFGRAELSVRLLRKLRPTRKFPDREALAAAIRRDIEAAREYFRRQD
ncbi:MAG TPA: riboflavin biosynthesis protein RibF [Burkholderiales bacterium]|nr:riboflavin biosynthesis protein RibF [Burkholderiales bacterium]